MSKFPTSLRAMQLVERGLLSLDDDVRPHLPELASSLVLKGFQSDGTPILEPYDVPVTLRQLLSHSAGLGYDIPDEDLIRWAREVKHTAKSTGGTLQGLMFPMRFVPGETWSYGTAIEWVGIPIERITGKRLEEYMKEEIFDKLGMESSGFYLRRLLEGGSGKEERFIPIAIRDTVSGELSLAMECPIPLE
jgi:Beta-lactamase class C and other penicillin binding proteins